MYENEFEMLFLCFVWIWMKFWDQSLKSKARTTRGVKNLSLYIKYSIKAKVSGQDPFLAILLAKSLEKGS